MKKRLPILTTIYLTINFTKIMSFNNTQTDGIYAFAKDGKFYVADSNGQETLNGKNYTTFENFTGYFTGIALSTRDEITNVLLQMASADGGEAATISFSIQSGYWKSFSRTFFNVDLSTACTLVPHVDKEERTVIFIIQNGETLKRFYTKDDPKDLPQPEKVKVNGQEVYDWAEQNDFLFNKISNIIQANKLPF